MSNFEVREELKQMVISKYLSYQDAPLSDEKKREAAEYSERSDSARKYSEALLQMTQYSLSEFETIATEMVSACKETLARMGLKPSPYTESLSWAMWDLGKQEYFFLHPDQNDPSYLRSDPVLSLEKRQEIIDRHVGWELFRAGLRNDSFLEHIREINRSRVMEFLSRTPKQNGTLSSKDLAELGSLARE